jgi:hypothetical protein
MPSTHTMILAASGTSSGTVSDSTETYGFLWPGCNRGVRFDIDRESETGTCTLAAKVQWIDQDTGDASDLLDQAGNAIAFNDWANGETGKRFIVIHGDDALGDDADGVLAVGSNFYYRQHLPFELQLVLTHGGTAVTNVYNATCTWLP